MRRFSHRTVVFPSVVAALALTAAGCNAGSESGASATVEETVVTGEPVPIDEELTALCEQVVAQGLPVDAAIALAEGSGYPYQVIEEAQTSDALPGGLIFTVSDDIVVDCTPG